VSGWREPFAFKDPLAGASAEWARTGLPAPGRCPCMVKDWQITDA
jgi:hypothetical protein